MANETIFTNGKIILGDQVINGDVVVHDAIIADISTTRTQIRNTIDLERDYLLPGLVELHTDNLEKHINPRPGVRWPTAAALLAHDSQVIGAGITSVFDALAVGDVRNDSARLQDLEETANGIDNAYRTNLLRADHYLHLRCEVSCNRLTDMFRPLAKRKMVRLISMMDHTPGQRQFLDPDQYKSYYAHKWGKSLSEIDEFIERQTIEGNRHSVPNRALISTHCQTHGIPLASHDDASPEHIEEAMGLGATIAEFPTTVVAARVARELGLEVVVGAPNLVCGGSHSGNVDAAEMASDGLVTTLSSDYVPLSLLHGVFRLSEPEIGLSLPQAVACASGVPARTVGLMDRGEIAVGHLADLVRVQILDDLPVVAGVWRNGKRVA